MVSRQQPLIYPSQCPSYNGCFAPICPLDASFKLARWYPDEPICQAMAYRRDEWLRAQVKISRNAKDMRMFYTVRMIEAERQVAPDISAPGPEGIIDRRRVGGWLRQWSGCQSTSPGLHPFSNGKSPELGSKERTSPREIVRTPPRPTESFSQPSLI